MSPFGHSVLITNSTLRDIQDLSFHYVNLDCGSPRLDFSKGIPHGQQPFLFLTGGQLYLSAHQYKPGLPCVRAPSFWLQSSQLLSAYPHANNTKRMNGQKDMHRIALPFNCSEIPMLPASFHFLLILFLAILSL